MTPGRGTRPRVGVSACLLGQRVRYDGGHKRDRLVLGALARTFEWIPVCPEVELGLGVPRDTLRLERAPGGTRLVFAGGGADITRAMNAWSRDRLRRLARLRLCGYLFKSGSPSCGLERVKVHASGRPGAPARSGVGLFARALTRRFPGLPVAEEGHLRDTARRREFVRRVLLYQRRRRTVASAAKRAGRS